MVYSSAYKVKNNCCLFKRLFKVKKKWRFPFWNIFFRFRDITFLYYANEEINDLINSFLKQ